MDWTNEAILQFLEAYKSEPCIWDTHNPAYKNKNKVVDAWERLRETLNFDCTVEDLKRKKNSLMASFRMLLNKKKKSIKSGTNGSFKTNWFAYKTMEEFLAPVYHYISINNTETVKMERNSDSQSPTSEPNYINDDDSNDDNFEEAEEEVIPEKNTSCRKTSSKSAECLTPNLPDKQNIGQRASEKCIGEAFNIFKDAEQKRREQDKDECDLYGELLAKKLRRINEQERDEVMLEIDTMLVQRKKKQLFHSVLIPELSPT